MVESSDSKVPVGQAGEHVELCIIKWNQGLREGVGKGCVCGGGGEVW